MNSSIAQNFDVKEYISASVEDLLRQNDAHMNTWGIGKSGGWTVNQDLGVVEWSFLDGRVVTAPVQIIGTYNPNDETFFWAWDHPAIVEPLKEHAKLIQEFGVKHKITKYVERKVVVSEDEAWEFIAVANRLAESNGGYKTGVGGTQVFMTFGEISLKQAESSKCA